MFIPTTVIGTTGILNLWNRLLSIAARKWEVILNPMPVHRRYRTYRSLRQTDIEHVVAVSEAHDSGLCAADAATKRRFANDLLNLTLSDPAVNRYQKSGKDAGEWMPRIDPRGFAETVIKVKRKYGLSIDRRERKALEMALAGDTLTVLADSLEVQVDVLPKENPLDLWDDNGNGQITCAEAGRGEGTGSPRCPAVSAGVRLHAGRGRRRLGLPRVIERVPQKSLVGEGRQCLFCFLRSFSPEFVKASGGETLKNSRLLRI